MMIGQLLSKIRHNTYIMQIVTLMSGTIVSQVLMLAIIPILTRIYTPDEFGVYSLFLSIVFILGVVSSWKYELAIMLPKDERDAQALVFLSLLITFGMTLFVTLVIALGHTLLLRSFPELSPIIWWIPFGVLLTGLFQIFTAFSSRHQFYKTISTVKVANAFSLAGVQTLSRYMLGYNGLVGGKLIADTLSVGLFVRHHWKQQTLQLKSFSKRRLYYNAKKHDNFPKYQSFTVFLNAISQNIPVLLLTSLYSAHVAGLYALTTRVLQAPVSLIGSSTREVYYQRASRQYANGENFFNLYMKTTMGLVKIFILPFVSVLLLGGPLFAFIFGEEWREAGYFAQILIFWFMFLFINTPSVISFSILGLQRIQLKLEVISVFLRFFSIYLGYALFDSYLMSIVLFTLSSVMINVVTIYIIYAKLKRGVS